VIKIKRYNCKQFERIYMSSATLFVWKCEQQSLSLKQMRVVPFDTAAFLFQLDRIMQFWIIAYKLVILDSLYVVSGVC